MDRIDRRTALKVAGAAGIALPSAPLMTCSRQAGLARKRRR
jgi:hypothetical protein